VLTPDGLGYIKVGQPVRTEPAATAIVSYDPTACSEIHPDIEREPGSPGAGGWFSTYVGDRFENFEVVTDELSEAGAVIAIDVYSPAISTDKGIHAGSTVAELTDAYPSIDRVVHTDRGTDIYVEDGTAGRLLMEVSTKDYYGSDVQPGHVLWIRAVRLAVEPYSISSSDAVGACPF
jgi:hypothetical protein